MAHTYLGDGYGMHGEIDPDSNERDRDQAWRERVDDRGRAMFSGRDRDRSGDWSGWRREEDGADSRARSAFSSNPDDHYRSWRDRHMSELDRDYRDYCREREQQFHRDFDQWRSQRHGNPQPLRTGMTQTGLSHDPSGVTQAAEDSAPLTATEPDPMADATLGTTSSRGPGSRR
jgi:hypothetical protein